MELRKNSSYSIPKDTLKSLGLKGQENLNMLDLTKPYYFYLLTGEHNGKKQHFAGHYNRSKIRCTVKMVPPDENFVTAHSQHRQNFSSGPGTSNF